MRNLVSYWKSLSIRTKVSSSFFLTTMLGVFLISIYANTMSNRILIDKAVVDNLGALQQLSEKLDSSFSHANSLTKLAITNNIIQENLSLDPDKQDQTEAYASQAAINITLARLVENSNILSGMAIYSLRDSRSYYSRGFQEYKTPDRSGRERILSSFREDEYIFWRNITPHIYRIYDENINGLRLYRRLYIATSGKLNALIESIIDEQYIASLYENILTRKDGSILILDKWGMAVSSADKSLIFQDFSQSELYRIAVERNPGGRVYSKGGRKFLAVSVYYEPLEWYVIGEMPVRSLQNEIKKITGQILLAGFGSVLFMLFISSILSKSLTRPILSLQNSVYESGHDMNVRAEVRSNDEIGNLAREYNEMLDKQQSMMARLVDEQKMIREYELSLLQAQINPHFLYNALENICGLIDLDRKKDAHDLINEMSRFYRSILSEGSNIVSMGEELRLTEHYINILNVRYKGRIDYKRDVPESLMGHPIVKMTLQPLIENAVYHGLKNTEPPWTIRLRAYHSLISVILELKDNGVGISSEEASDSEFFGFGTKCHPAFLLTHLGRRTVPPRLQTI